MFDILARAYKSLDETDYTFVYKSDSDHWKEIVGSITNTLDKLEQKYTINREDEYFLIKIV